MMTSASGKNDPAESDLDRLSTAVLLIDRAGNVRKANVAAEMTFDLSRRLLEGHAVRSLFVQSVQIDELIAAIPADGEFPRRRLLMAVRRSLREPLPVVVVAGPATGDGLAMVLEVFDSGVVGRMAREDRRTDVSETNRRLLRNLAHEIRNPLGGIRGAAQLLESELSGPGQREYTRVIIAESDRLQSLLDRVLAPSPGARCGPRVVETINIHEVCERVRSVILAEHPAGLTVVRDYDASIPEIQVDREQLIQVLLNVARNAAQALAARIEHGDACIVLRTRIARQVTFARFHCPLALDLLVIDNGPGVAEEIRERVFDPLVSGREGGSGLGLALAQGYIEDNGGMIDFETEPGRTEFRIRLPIDRAPGGTME